MLSIPLQQLTVSETHNVRRTDRRKHLDELVASIAAHGLLENLLVVETDDDRYEVIAARLGVDVAKHWRPTQENFLGRVTKDELLSIGEGLFGTSWPGQYRKSKKADIASLLHNTFNRPDTANITEEQRVAVEAWLPEGMACGTDKACAAHSLLSQVDRSCAIIPPHEYRTGQADPTGRGAPAFRTRAETPGARPAVVLKPVPAGEDTVV